MNTLTVRQGELLPLTIETSQPDAEYVRFIVKKTKDDIDLVLDVSADFEEQKAFIEPLVLLDPGTYIWQLNVFYTGSTSPEKWPAPESCIENCSGDPDCESDCALPQLLVCDAIDNEGTIS